ncbi:RNB domain-containing ribonuclease [Brevibacterium otitidis]|uniref:RNB domain-containing ribonuclease n=1 Tax=Brevibacterium otitidis TaxID=53364 RepID=A0ABV5WZP4_9MICO|nr:RNB domain-containing ribonuclease [Brevibacterium otitidis]
MLTSLHLPSSLTPRRREPAPGPLAAKLQAAYTRLASGLPEEYPAEALAEAEAAVAELGDDPFATGRDGITAERIDLREIPFVTIDPKGATDLDQAMHLSVLGAGAQAPADGPAFRVRYAIADVGRFITPGGRLDRETHARGQTIYLPDRRIPLHPEIISEGAASLLPGVDRAAYVFTVELNADGTIHSQELVRAVVRSRTQLDYDAVQADHDAGRALPETIAWLPEIGAALQADEAARGGIDLAIPDQDVVEADGDYTLTYRPRQGIEDANAQISLLAGRVAANLMLEAGQGVLRTMPRPKDETIADFLAIVAGLGFPADAPYQDVIRSIGHQERNPRALAVHYASPSLFRGAGYTLISEDAADSELLQAAVGAPYAHTTAPLRRLIDRYVLPLAEAASRGAEPPAWALAGLEELPEVMQKSGQRASQIDRQVIEYTEAILLAERIGEAFDGVFVGSRTTKSGTRLVEVHVPEPAVVVWAEGEAPVGEPVRIRLRAAEPEAGKLFFDVV